MTTVRLSDRLTQRVLYAELIRDISRDMFATVAKTWDAQRQAFRAQPRASVEMPEYFSWNWEQKALTTTPEEHDFFGVWLDGKMQGMMMLARKPMAVRNTATSEKCALYIEYLESAPWNLWGYTGSYASFGGVGSALISIAALESRNAGCGGRLACTRSKLLKPFTEAWASRI